ncbi:DUF4836 family protein [Bacteroides sp. 51]|uniref:DUF4836 family protein n=1 Tax=Bacteroides sp. 51 TaxID=2302938 RepID=UPI0013D681F9|nr:DUF4836 family protein [Bacteroides sp. 51]NDV84079.1 DUF4836 family protein [Bacteroides sp. 51]
MKKNLIARLFTLVVLVACMASCSEKSSEYTNVIPADASAVVAIHFQSLVDKSGVSNDDKQKLIDAMKGELNAATFQHVEKIIKDGSASGLSIKDPVYFFTSSLIPSAAVVMKVSDMDKLNKTFEVMASEQISDPVTKIDGYYLVKIKGASVCAFNESTLLITEERNSDKIVADLMKQTKDESIAKSAYFQSMAKKKGEITFFSTMDALPSMYKRQMDMTLGSMDNIDPKDIGVAGGLNFEKGKIALHFEAVSENEKVKEMFKKQNDISGKLSEAFLANFPSSTLMYMSVNVNGEKLYDMLQENKDFREGLSLDKAEKVKAIFGSFKGDISGGLINVTMSDMPTFAAYAEAKNGAALEALYEAKGDLGLRRSEDIVKLGDNEYVYKSRQMNVFFGYKDNYMYATNDELLYKNIGKKEDKSLKEAAYASNMKGKHQYVVIDMKAILDLPAVKMLSAMGGKEAARYIDMASKVSYFEVIGEGNNQSNINLWLVDKDTNSLKQIIDLAKQYAGI